MPSNYQQDVGDSDSLEYAYSDDLGFIPNRPGEQALAEGRRRLFMVGGSTVQWGAASNYDKTLPSYIEVFLSACFEIRHPTVLQGGQASD